MPVTVEQLKAKLSTAITIDNQNFYADGDILLSESQLESYAAAAPTPADKIKEAMAQTLAGKVVKWKGGHVLTYAVLRDTFPDAATFGKTVAAIESAALEWERACGIEFLHKAALDTAAGAEKEVVFTVRHLPARTHRLLAAAFFPADPKTGRMVVIDPAFFDAHGFDPEGILRHELGHVLGFRHEHIRSAVAAPSFPPETLSETFELSEYDAKSVMHYVNNQFGNGKLTLTSLDRLAAQRIYGLPRSMVTEVV